MTMKLLVNRAAAVAAIGAAAGMTPVAMASTGQAEVPLQPVTRALYAEAPDADADDPGYAADDESDGGAQAPDSGGAQAPGSGGAAGTR